MRVRELTSADWPAVEQIYAEGIAGRMSTFETAPPSWEAFDASRLRWGRLGAEREDGALSGWIAASPASSRACYSGVVEHSVYVASAQRGRGVGRALLQAFLTEARAHGAWTVQAALFPENDASVALHERAGFRQVGRRERIARLDGRWRDTVLYELRLPDR